jgi:hypothetical protein
MPRHDGMLKLRPPPASCASNSTFVSLLSNESWVPGALCLLKAMAAVRSRCPLLLVVDDVTNRGTQRAIPESALATLRSAFGTGSVMPLSRMTERISQHEARATLGRRLKQEAHPSGWVQNTHGKLLLFALPGFRRAAFLDLDMVRRPYAAPEERVPPPPLPSCSPMPTPVLCAGRR